jgi:dienelactone hydrolase
MATVERTKVRFESGGVACVGYVYQPTGVGGPAPCVVMGTGFSGTQDTPSIQAVAHTFAEAGFAALTFDYRHFGESDGPRANWFASRVNKRTSTPRSGAPAATTASIRSGSRCGGLRWAAAM